jgi:hypothetical protein
MSGRAWVVGAIAIAGAVTGAAPASAATRVVGPGHPYAKPCQAIAAARPGDVVQIDAAGNGTYDGDVCASGVARLTIEGINGRAHVDAAGRSSGGKAIWVLSGAGMVVRNVELSGAKVPDRNGAAIRLEGGDLTLDGVFFHDDEDGILVANDPAIDLTIERSQFARNGAGDGQSHNIYVGAIHRFTMRSSWSHDAKVGHLVKSRAAINDIMFNRLTGERGSSSYELDLPNGGRSHVVGNLIEQGPATENATMLAYGEEGATDPGARLTIVANTFVNDRHGPATAIGVGAGVRAPAVVANNIAVDATTFVSQAAAQLRGNCLAADPRFADRARFDYRLAAGSPCRDAGVADPAGGLPAQQYRYDVGLAPRAVSGGAPDAGAFESAGPAGLAVTSRVVRRDGSLRLGLVVPGRGRVSARATVPRGGRRVTYASGAARVGAAGARTVTLRPTRAGGRELRRAGRLTVTIAVAYTSASGARTTRSTTLRLRRTAAGVRRG